MARRCCRPRRSRSSSRPMAAFPRIRCARASASSADRARAGLPDGVAEFYLHPVARAWRPGDPWPRDYNGLGELRALTDPAVAAAVAAAGIRLATFATAFAD